MLIKCCFFVLNIFFSLIFIVVGEKLTRTKMKEGVVPTLNMPQKSHNPKAVTRRLLRTYEACMSHKEHSCYKNLRLIF